MTWIAWYQRIGPHEFKVWDLVTKSRYFGLLYRAPHRSPLRPRRALYRISFTFRKAAKP